MISARVIVADPAWEPRDKLPAETQEPLAYTREHELVARALSRVTEDPRTGCWLWTRSKTVRGGYAQMNIGNNRVVRVHRWLYELLVAPVDVGIDLDHLCRVRHCVNPSHLEPVTRGENVRRGAAAQPKPTCAKGHVVDGNNAYVRPTGRRECAMCKRERRNNAG